MKKNFKSPYVIGVDAGTQSVRTVIFDMEGKPVVFANKSYPTYFPKPGWAEQDVYDCWEAIVSTIKECITNSKIPKNEIIGIAVDGTASTVIPVDKDGTPLRRAILWMDSRAHRQAKKISNTNHPILKYVGGKESAEWMVPKCLWIKENEPEIFQKAQYITEITDWLTWKLSNNWTTSICSATCKSNYVSIKGGWDEKFFNAIDAEDILKKWPQKVLFMGDKVGELVPEVANELGLCPNITVGQSGVDAHVGMIGLGAVKPGKLAMILGSSTVHLVLSDKPYFDEGIWGPYPDAVTKGLWLMEGGQISSGSIVNWYKDNFAYKELCEANEKKINIFNILDKKAEVISPGSAGLIALDFWQGNRTPLRDPLLSGCIWGLRLHHKVEHILRAIYEGTSFGTRHILETFSKSGLNISEIYACGGGTRSSLWLQIHSDVCNLPIYLTKVEEASALGSAICAVVASGIYQSIDEATQKMVHIRQKIMPNVSNNNAYQFYYDKYLATYPRLTELMHHMTIHEETSY
jgi:FGGY-family pentulose kinase